MELRREQLWVSFPVKRALTLLAKGKKSEDGISTMSYDEIGDKLLWQVIEQQHPEILDHFKKIKKLETELLKHWEQEAEQ